MQTTKTLYVIIVLIKYYRFYERVILKILSIDIKNHEKLGDLFLDFRVNDNPSNCIIIAGDNGTGKSTILNVIQMIFSSELIRSIPLNINISIEVLVTLKEINKFNEELKSKLFDNNSQGEGFFEIFSKKGNIYNNFLYIKNLANNKEAALSQDGLRSIFINTDDVSMPKKINQIGSSSLDDKLNEKVRNEQLIIDINSQDNNDFSNSIGDDLKIGQSINENNINNFKKRIKIFKKAFNDFFESNNLIFKEINSVNDILFEKDGKTFPATDFSKGENQIFNVACQILKNRNLISNIIVDEPENGLHPGWQLKLLNYYKSLAGDQQIIISTHSPFIINSINENDKLIILKREDGVIKVDETNEFYSIGEIERVSKGMALIPNADRIQIVVGGKTDKMYFDQTIKLWESDFKELSKIDVLYTLGDSSGDSNLGKSGGDQNLVKLHKMNHILIRGTNIYFVYDCDIKKEIKREIKDLKNTQLMVLTVEIKEECNFNLQFETKITGIENFIKINKEDIVLNIGVIFKRATIEWKGNYEVTELSDKKLFAEYIIREKNKDDFKFLKDFLLKITQDSKND